MPDRVARRGVQAGAPVPTLLLTGFLGAGKTTLLSGWLEGRPAGERWAVLVNEFGTLGVDRALLSGAGDPSQPDAVGIVEIAGGCACCAARVAFSTALNRLLRRGPWDRLFVETTGLGHPGELLEQLRAPSLAPWLQVLPPVAVVDATRAGLYTDAGRAGHSLAADQVALARVLVLNRVDEVGTDVARGMADALAGLPPWPRPVLPTGSGRLPLAAVLAALDASPSAAPADDAEDRARTDARPSAGPSGTPAASSAASVARWWPASVGFDRMCLQPAIAALTAADGPLRAHGLLRGKGVFRTERAWYAWQWVDGQSRWDETAWRADSRLELIAKTPIDPRVVDNALQAAFRRG
jgi:G3E family GTPase